MQYSGIANSSFLKPYQYHRQGRNEKDTKSCPPAVRVVISIPPWKIEEPYRAGKNNCCSRKEFDDFPESKFCKRDVIYGERVYPDIRNKANGANEQSPEEHAPSAYQFPEKESIHMDRLFSTARLILSSSDPRTYIPSISMNVRLSFPLFSRISRFLFRSPAMSYTVRFTPKFRRTSRVLLEPGHQLVM